MVKTFYGKEHYIVLDYVQRNKCIKEDDLRQLIKFDQRFLRTVIFTFHLAECLQFLYMKLSFESICECNGYLTLYHKFHFPFA